MTNVDWAIWRPVMEGLDTLVNVQTVWNIDDLFDAHEALDIKAEMEREALEEARRRSGDR